MCRMSCAIARAQDDEGGNDDDESSEGSSTSFEENNRSDVSAIKVSGKGCFKGVQRSAQGKPQPKTIYYQAKYNGVQLGKSYSHPVGEAPDLKIVCLL